MAERIDAQTAIAQFGQIMDRAAKNNERFVVDLDNDESVVIVSVQEFLRVAMGPAPDWLQEAWQRSKEQGLEKMTMDEIDAEIAEVRRETRTAAVHTTR